jgi:hypothetical protein
MEAPKFDSLLRKAAQQTTRREAVGALLGGALLLGTLGESEATRKGKRRKKRKRGGPTWRDVSFWVNNRAGTSAATGVYGYWDFSLGSAPGGCRPSPAFNLPPGGAERYFADYFRGYVWIKGQYFFSFENPLFGKEKVSAAYGGRSTFMPARNCPAPVGTNVVTDAPLAVGQEIPITLNGKVFRVKRYKDTSSNKIFEIIVPPGI